MPIYLYVKTHRKTGLKYFGKTVKDPLTYKGPVLDGFITSESMGTTVTPR